MRGAAPNPQKPVDEEAAQLNEVLRLRRRMSLRAVGEVMGVSYTTVSRWEKRALALTVMPEADAYRKVQLERYERQLDALRYDETGRVVAEDREFWLKIIARIDVLTGAPAPVRSDVTVTETTQRDMELAELMREEKARHAARSAPLAADASRPRSEPPSGRDDATRDDATTGADRSAVPAAPGNWA